MWLHLIRHGESIINRDGWQHLPNLDVELTDKGHQQAAALRDWLSKTGAEGDALYCSSLLRARETAAYIQDALGLSATVTDSLREIGTCYATGRPIPALDLPRTFIDQWVDTAPFASRTRDLEDVESWMHFRVRLGQFVDVLVERHPGQKVYLVAHGAVITAIFDNIFNVGQHRRCDTHIQNTGCTLFEYRADHQREPWFLRYHNRADHLTEGL